VAAGRGVLPGEGHLQLGGAFAVRESCCGYTVLDADRVRVSRGPVGGRHASADLAGQTGRPGGDDARSADHGGDGRDRPGHLDRDLWLGPASLRGPRPVPEAGRHPRARADGRRRGGRRRGDPHRAGRPRGRAVQHLLRLLLDVFPAAVRAVRDHPGPRPGQGRGAARLHLAVRIGPRRSGRVSASPAGPLRPDPGARRPVRPALRLPVGRTADGLAGGALRRRPRRRHARRPRPRPDRSDERRIGRHLGAERPIGVDDVGIVGVSRPGRPKWSTAENPAPQPDGRPGRTTSGHARERRPRECVRTGAVRPPLECFWAGQPPS
jgi:hypothetical protein